MQLRQTLLRSSALLALLACSAAAAQQLASQAAAASASAKPMLSAPPAAVKGTPAKQQLPAAQRRSALGSELVQTRCETGNCPGGGIKPTGPQPKPGKAADMGDPGQANAVPQPPNAARTSPR